MSAALGPFSQWISVSVDLIAVLERAFWEVEEVETMALKLLPQLSEIALWPALARSCTKVL
ncbi:MAG: hypothetical protein F4Y89_10455 [Gammaproteobacteria bacterium]|nr:hypothetical protein [Gammaproteobacteria bacterium]